MGKDIRGIERGKCACGECNGFMRSHLSPPQRLLLVNTRERNWSGSAGERKRERGERWEEAFFLSFPFPAFPARFNFSSSQPPRAADIFFPRPDCRRPLRRRERSHENPQALETESSVIRNDRTLIPIS